MNYYKMRAMIYEDSKNFLIEYPQYSLNAFCQSMSKKYGVTRKTVESVFIESYGMKFQNNELVKIDEQLERA